MGRAPKTAISAFVVTIVCACEAPLKFNEPPADTYTVGAREMKIGDDDISVQGATVTAGFFAATGVHPLLGRFIIAADEGASAPAVAVLSHDLWVERFDSSPGIIGRQIELDGRTFIVVGRRSKRIPISGLDAVVDLEEQRRSLTTTCSADSLGRPR